MAVFDNMNLTYSGGVAPSVTQYYERTLVENARKNLVHCKDLQRRTLPRNNGRTVNFRRMTPFDPITTPLQEGVTPTGQTLTMSSVTATVRPYGRHVELTDEMDWALLDNIHKETAELLSNQAVESIDKVAADALSSGLNVIYVDAENGVNSSRSAITADDKLTHEAVKRAVRILEKNNAKRFPDGYYHAIIDPATKYDLTSDALFTATSQYQDKSKVEKYELGTIYGVKFFETSQAKTFPSGAKLYADKTEVQLTAGKAADKSVSVAMSSISTDRGVQEDYVRSMAGKLVQIYDASATAYFPAVIDRVEISGTTFVHKLRWIGSDNWTWASGDKLAATGSGASGYEVHSTVVYGRDAAGCVELDGDGGNVEIIIKPSGSSGALDPLNQRASIAWKVRGFCATILQDAYIVRIEHGVSE